MFETVVPSDHVANEGLLLHRTKSLCIVLQAKYQQERALS